MTGRALHAVVLPSGPTMYDAVRRALDGGPAVLPVDPALPAERVRALLTALRPHAVVGVDGDLVALTDPAPCADDVALVVSTSGSTGEPKGVELTASALRHSASATLERLAARPGDRWLCCLPTSYIAGLQVLVRSLVGGTTPVIHERFDVQAVAASDATFASLVPTMLQRLLEAGVDLARFRALLLGGAPCPPSLRARAADAGAHCVVTYGMTETCGGCCYDGEPLDGVALRLEPDGRILVGGPVLARGYRLRPDLTDGTFVDGWLRTNDVGERLADGRLAVRGRIADVIITGGRKVFPGELERLLTSHPEVREVAVVGRPDEEWGERVVAYIVPAVAAAPPSLADLREYVAGRTERWQAPRELVLLDHLPTLASGKVDRRAVGS